MGTTEHCYEVVFKRAYDRLAAFLCCICGGYNWKVTLELCKIFLFALTFHYPALNVLAYIFYLLGNHLSFQVF